MNASLLVAWIVSAMTAWTHGKEIDRDVRYEGIARVLLTNAFDALEPTSYDGAHARARSALLVAAVAAMESNFREDVQAGRCKPWECDGGLAHCWMQIHDGGGLVPEADGGVRYAHDVRDDSGIRVVYGRDLELDRRMCFRVGGRMIAKSMRATGTLGNYTGEYWGDGEPPKARMRRGVADRWFTAHPPPVADADVAK